MDSAAFSNASSSASTNVNQKIHNDLQLVVDKMNGCELLLQTSKLPTQELLAVVGFLEACQPRLVELVEAAAQGALSEQVLMECLQVNDRLTKLLSDVDHQVDFSQATSAVVEDDSTTLLQPQFVIQDEAANDDLLLMEDFAATTETTTTNPAGPKTTGEDLDDLLDLNSDVALDQLVIEDVNASEAAAAVKPTKSEDEFDDFISSRQT